ncbi:hypothetical protein ACLOJK_020124 [Asimina triloba]
MRLHVISGAVSHFTVYLGEAIVSHRMQGRFPLILLNRSPLKSSTSSSSSSSIETAVPSSSSRPNELPHSIPLHTARHYCPVEAIFLHFADATAVPSDAPNPTQTSCSSSVVPSLSIAGRLASRLPLQLHSKRVLRCT